MAYESVALIAGNGVYPETFVRAARKAGVKRLVAAAFTGETKPELAEQVIAGAYWRIEPDPDAELSLVVSGQVVQEALEAHQQIIPDIPGAGLLVVTSADRLQREWIEARRAPVTGTGSYIEPVLGRLHASAGLVTLLDGHSAALSWLGAVKNHRVVRLDNERFGQSGNIPDLYRTYGLDADAIVGAVARLCVEAVRR